MCLLAPPPVLDCREEELLVFRVSVIQTVEREGGKWRLILSVSVRLALVGVVPVPVQVAGAEVLPVTGAASSFLFS